MTRFSKFLQSAVDIPVLATSALGMALLAIGIALFTPTGEQSKLQYPPDLWCVSNYIEQRPQEILPDGRPRQDKLLDGKEEWIVRDQVKAPSKEEAEKIAQANGKGRFEPSNQDELRTKLQANDKDFFTSHFNTGATIAGPCWGTGSTTSQTGRWLNDALREDCFGIEPPSNPEGNLTSAVLTNGSCKTKPIAVQRIKGSTINTPASGIAAVEQHLVTKEENFQPTSGKDRIDNHYAITEKAIGIKYSHERGWTGAEGGGSIGGGSASPPPAAVEPYVVNMYWANRPPEGTRMVLTNPANGKSVVAAAGYETGPGNLSYVIGAQEEAMQAIGAQTGTKLEFGFAEDQSLPFGPINCQDKTSINTDTNSSLSLSQSISSFLSGIFLTQDAFAATKTIVIDPGHGSAANSNAPNEGPTELAIGLKLKNILEQKGYKVVMTHSSIGEKIGGVSSGPNEDNIARAEIANNANADLTIRLHADTNSKDQFAAIYPSAQAKDVSGHFGPSDTSVLTKSKTLAQNVQKALTSAGFSGSIKTEEEYLGNNRQILVFSTYTKSPVVTLELYGYQNAALRQKYASPDTQQKVAAALASAVDSYEGVSGASAEQQADKPATKQANAPSNCPDTAPSEGPSEGQDYRAQIAKEFERQYSILTGGEATSEETGPDHFPPPAAGSIAQIAESQVGYQGHGEDNDCTKYDGCAQWCAYFATWVYKQAGLPIPSMGGAKETLSWFKNHAHSVFTDPAQVGEGDIVVWSRKGGGHIGIIIKNDTANRQITVVAGNNPSNHVAKTTYSYSTIKNSYGLVLVGFGRW